MNILIIDPSPSYRELVKELLSADDVTVFEAANGEQALSYLKKNVPNAISISHELGDMDSFRFLRKLKLKEVLNHIPKFLLTSNKEQAFKRKAYDAGFTEVFVKSDIQTLKRALKSLMLYATTHLSAKVLYIEDTQSTADYTSHIMTRAGWEVTHVTSGEEAAEILDKKKQYFDLVVTDLVLKGALSGIGLIHLIRQGHESIRHLPILAVSGWNDLLRQVYVLKHGAGDFIAKPFHESDFLARAINLILNKKRFDESKAAEKALYLKANLDVATGLNNRHYIEEYGNKRVQDAIANNQGVALMILDIDHFKRINDTYGHAAGDSVLKQVATLIKSLCRANSLVVRYGGDELVVLMTECDHDEAYERADKMRTQIEAMKPEGIDVTVTIGVASHDKRVAVELVALLNNLNQMPTEGLALDFDTLFHAADHSLYAAKQAGRNQVCLNNLLESSDPISS